MGSQKHLQEASFSRHARSCYPFWPVSRDSSKKRASYIVCLGGGGGGKAAFSRDNAPAIVLLNQSDRVHQLQMCMHNNECRFSIGGATLISGRCRCATATVAALRSSHHRRRGSIGAKGPRGPRRVPRLRTCTCATTAADTAN
jgi:hypothetical protein